MKIIGGSGCKYILAIDPSFSNSPTSDYFAMSVMEIDDESKQGTLIHCYAVAGGDLKDHINYLFYLIENFDIIMIIIDNAGYQFIDSANESEKFLKNKLKDKKIIDNPEKLTDLKQLQDFQKMYSEKIKNGNKKQ